MIQPVWVDMWSHVQSSSTMKLGFLEQDYCYKSVAIQIPHAGLAPIWPAGD